MITFIVKRISINRLIHICVSFLEGNKNETPNGFHHWWLFWIHNSNEFIKSVCHTTDRNRINDSEKKCRVHMSDSYLPLWYEVHRQFRHWSQWSHVMRTGWWSQTLQLEKLGAWLFPLHNYHKKTYTSVVMYSYNITRVLRRVRRNWH